MVSSAIGLVSFVRTISFAPFAFEPSSGRLTKYGHRIKLQGKSAEILRCLLEEPGRLVTRAELEKRLWPDGTYVDYQLGVRVALKKLRDALGDSADNPVYIRTVRGEGYRFIAPVEEASAGPVPPAFAAATNPGAAAELPDRITHPGHELISSVPAAAVASQSWFRTMKLPLAVALCIALTLATVVELRSRSAHATDQPRKITLVVLPFENLSGDPAQEYLSDGITEELSARLGNLNPDRLGVIGRTSAMTYKRLPRTISQIGKELGVAYVLEGSVRRDANKVRVTAQLISTDDQVHVWAQDYDRDMQHFLNVEDEVASDIARRVGITMALRSEPPSKPSHVPNPEAYEAYLLARYYSYKRTPEGWSKCAQYSRRAVQKDPEYAAAYAELAACDWQAADSLAVAMKAVELDPDSAEARTALSWVEFFKEWDFVAAAAALKTAIQLDPNYALAHHLYSAVLQGGGRLNEAIAEEEQAVRVDPLFLVSRVSLAEELSVAGQYDRAVAQVNQTLAIDPAYPKAHETLGLIYLRRQMYKEAIAELNASLRYGGRKPVAWLAYAYARSGAHHQALAMRSELQKAEKKSPSGDLSDDLAIVELGLGNIDAALAWLEKEYQQHDSDGPWGAKFDPIFEPLRSHPRFQALMARVQLPQ